MIIIGKDLLVSIIRKELTLRISPVFVSVVMFLPWVCLSVFLNLSAVWGMVFYSMF